MMTIFQLLVIGLIVVQIVLIIAAMIHLRRQSLSERDLLLWDLIVLFVPFGAIVAFIYFPMNRKF